MNDSQPLFTGVNKSVSERRIGKRHPIAPHTATSAVPAGLLQEVDESIRLECSRKAQAFVEQLASLLGRPFYARDGFVLYHNDCGTVLRAIAERGMSTDLTLTSPPYNIGKDYERKMPLDNYLSWCGEWMNEVWAATSPRGAFWLNLGYLSVEGKGRAVPIAYLLWGRSPFFLQQEIIWNYGAGVTTKRVFTPRNEKWLYYTKDAEQYVFNLDDVRDPNVKYPDQKKNGKFRCNPLGKNPSDVWEFPKVTTGANRSSRERTSHPAQFPLGVVDRIVKVSSNYGNVVFDPFSGSGSSGIAAVGNGRVFIGVEIRSDYCTISAERHSHFLQLRERRLEQMDLALL